MELLDIKEHVSLTAPATYELSITLNAELMRASFDMGKRIDFYDAFTKALSSNIYSFKSSHYPKENLSFYTDSGNFFAYNESVQKKYLDILKALNYRTDDIIEQAKSSYSYNDKDKMKNCINNFLSQHFLNHELEIENYKNNIPRFRLFTLYEDVMKDMYCIGIKINEKDIIDNSSLSVLFKFDEFFSKTLSKNLYEYKRTIFPNERMNFSQDSGTLFTFNKNFHSSCLNLLNNLNKQSYEIFNKLKEINSNFKDPTESYLQTYISQHFLKFELEKTEKPIQTTSIKKMKV